MNEKKEKGNKISPIVLAVIIIVGALILAGIAAAIADSLQSAATVNIDREPTYPTSIGSNEQPQQSQASSPQPIYDLPRYYKPMTFPPNVEANRSSFVNGCVSTSRTLNVCNCDFDYLISNYGLTWLIEANINYEVNGVVAPQLASAARYCSPWDN